MEHNTAIGKEYCRAIESYVYIGIHTSFIMCSAGDEYYPGGRKKLEEVLLLVKKSPRLQSTPENLRASSILEEGCHMGG